MLSPGMLVIQRAVLHLESKLIGQSLEIRERIVESLQAALSVLRFLFEGEEEDRIHRLHDSADMLEALLDVLWLEMGEDRLSQQVVERFPRELFESQVPVPTDEQPGLLLRKAFLLNELLSILDGLGRNIHT